jgi:hypothetical protein
MQDSRKLMQTVHESIASTVTTDVSGVPAWEFLCCDSWSAFKGNIFINIKTCSVCSHATVMPFMSLDLEFSNLHCFHYGYIITAQHTAARNGAFKSAIKYIILNCYWLRHAPDANCDILPLKSQIYSQLGFNIN